MPLAGRIQCWMGIKQTVYSAVQSHLDVDTTLSTTGPILVCFIVIEPQNIRESDQMPVGESPERAESGAPRGLTGGQQKLFTATEPVD